MKTKIQKLMIWVLGIIAVVIAIVYIKRKNRIEPIERSGNDTKNGLSSDDTNDLAAGLVDKGSAKLKDFITSKIS